MFVYKDDNHPTEVPQLIVRLDDGVFRQVNEDELQLPPDMVNHVVMSVDSLINPSKPVNTTLATADYAVAQGCRDALILACAWWTRRSTVEKASRLNTAPLRRGSLGSIFAQEAARCNSAIANAKPC